MTTLGHVLFGCTIGILISMVSSLLVCYFTENLEVGSTIASTGAILALITGAWYHRETN